MLSWFLEQLHPLQPGFWLLLSMITALLGFMAEKRLLPVQAAQLRMSRWILVPYLGLITGGLSPRLMGLSDLDWVAGLGLGLALIAGLWLLLVFARIALHLEQDAEESTAPPLRMQNGFHWPKQVAYAGTQEFHWSFLRGAAWEILLTFPIALPDALSTPAYTAVWLASMLALPGILFHHTRTPQRAIGLVILVMTAILFFFTRNFWLCWLLHATAQVILGQSLLSVSAPEQRHPTR